MHTPHSFVQIPSSHCAMSFLPIKLVNTYIMIAKLLKNGAFNRAEIALLIIDVEHLIIVFIGRNLKLG